MMQTQEKKTAANQTMRRVLEVIVVGMVKIATPPATEKKTRAAQESARGLTLTASIPVRNPAVKTRSAPSSGASPARNAALKNQNQLAQEASAAPSHGL